MEKIIESLKFLPKIGLAITYPVLLIIGLVLFFGRNLENWRFDFLLNAMPDFYDHVSNFSISLLIYITIGYTGLLLGLKLKHLLIVGGFIVLVNFMVEFFMSFLNTPDMVDAVYGLFGVFFGLVFIWAGKKYGLKMNESYKRER